MVVTKLYNSAFIVETSTLTRLLSVIQNSLKQGDVSYSELFHVEFGNHKTSHTDSVQHVLDLDNSERTRVERLIITCAAGPESDQHVIHIDFDGRRHPVDVTIEVTSDDRKSAEDIMSVAEEQIERMLERGLIYRIYNNIMSEPIFVTPIFLVLVVTLMIGFVFANQLGRSDIRRLDSNMWLTPMDIAEIQADVEGSKVFSPEQELDIVTRQLKNLIAIEQENTLSRSIFTDWRLILIALPCIIIIIISIFALRYCYPSAVFAWGMLKNGTRSLLVEER